MYCESQPFTQRQRIIKVSPTCRDHSFVAIKILKGDSTSLHESGFFRELDALKAIAPEKGNMATTHCLRLFDGFKFKGKGRDGKHLSIVTEVLGPTVSQVRKELGEPFPIPFVKRMCRHILLGLARLHDKGIAHTGVSVRFPLETCSPFP